MRMASWPVIRPELRSWLRAEQQSPPSELSVATCRSSAPGAAPHSALRLRLMRTAAERCLEMGPALEERIRQYHLVTLTWKTGEICARVGAPELLTGRRRAVR